MGSILREIRVSEKEPLTEGQLARSGGIDAQIVATAAQIIDEVRSGGDTVLRSLTERFDGVALEALRVTQEESDRAEHEVEPEVAEALECAAKSIEDFHARGLQQSWFTTRDDGALVGTKVTPLDSVGIYVPGGRAQYPSTVLMNAIPARVAGVARIAMVVPPQKDGTVNPYTLVAASIAGVTEIYKVGGAQAIAALAYGTESIARVDKITGPGNAYVAAAKKLVNGDVGIDMIAGPSEVLVLADESAEPSLVAIDLMAQAEHDPRAACYLVTTDPTLPGEVEAALEALLAESPRGDITAQSLRDNGVCVVCDDLASALGAVNLIAPEHLEVVMEEPFELLGAIKHAGAIFLGPWTCESLGDYAAGPNHTLPTGGTARFSSPLSCDDFCKKSSVLSYSFPALEADAPTVEAIATKEGLWAHARAVSLRLELVDEFEQASQQEGGDA